MTSRDNGLDSELESFRNQWLSDLQSRRDEPQTQAEPRSPQSSSSRPAARQHSIPTIPPSAPHRPHAADEDEDYVQHRAFDEPAPASGRTLAEPAAKQTEHGDSKPVSALDHFEKAMEKEAEGNMGDSLTLYRKAYRLDHGVDRRYREKHFPASSSKPASSAPPPQTPSAPSQPTTTTTTAPDAQPQSIGDLIASFASLRVDPVPPEVEGMPQPPCPIADLPDELLVHILQDVAVDDVGDFGRLALVCKHFAYLVATEQRIWRRLCVGSEFGFQAMHFHWQRNIDWTPLEQREEEDPDGTLVSMRELAERRADESLRFTLSLAPSVYPSWKTMFRTRPRIRFNGCYICTVNYIRSGQASTNQLTWGGAPIHIVTYYRYLRFYRDGTAISLLTTDEPSDVVHHMTKDLLQLHRGRAHPNLPSGVMIHALRGRWRLSSALDHPDAAPKDQEGDVFVETEAPTGPKYTYRMDLTLRSAGKAAARNNKMAWRGFYSYNKLTDDLATFGLKHDKPFFFSRVRSYGVRGE